MSSKAWEKIYVTVFRQMEGHKVIFMTRSQCEKRTNAQIKSWEEIQKFLTLLSNKIFSFSFFLLYVKCLYNESILFSE